MRENKRPKPPGSLECSKLKNVNLSLSSEPGRFILRWKNVYNLYSSFIIINVNFSEFHNLHAPVAQQITHEVFFDVSKVKESSFFKSDLTDQVTAKNIQG